MGAVGASLALLRPRGRVTSVGLRKAEAGCAAVGGRRGGNNGPPSAWPMNRARSGRIAMPCCRLARRPKQLLSATRAVTAADVRTACCHGSHPAALSVVMTAQLAPWRRALLLAVVWRAARLAPKLRRYHALRARCSAAPPPAHTPRPWQRPRRLPLTRPPDRPPFPSGCFRRPHALTAAPAVTPPNSPPRMPVLRRRPAPPPHRGSPAESYRATLAGRTRRLMQGGQARRGRRDRQLRAPHLLTREDYERLQHNAAQSSAKRRRQQERARRSIVEALGGGSAQAAS